MANQHFASGWLKSKLNCRHRAQQKGEGISLTRQGARGLAGDWYDWFIARHPFNGDDQEKWKHLRDDINEAIHEEIGDQRWEANDPDDLWREDEDLRKSIRPTLADAGETAQFFAMRGIVLNEDARAQFLDFLYEDLAAALERFRIIASGNYGADKYRERFPKFEGADAAIRPGSYSSGGSLSANLRPPPLKAGSTFSSQ